MFSGSCDILALSCQRNIPLEEDTFCTKGESFWIHPKGSAKGSAVTRWIQLLLFFHVEWVIIVFNRASSLYGFEDSLFGLL